MRDALLQKLFSLSPDTTLEVVVQLARTLWAEQHTEGYTGGCLEEERFQSCRSVSKRQIDSLPFLLFILHTIPIDCWLILLSPSHKRPHCFGEGASESGVRIFDARRNRRIGLAFDKAVTVKTVEGLAKDAG
jgi:hypothetical protein